MAFDDLIFLAKGPVKVPALAEKLRQKEDEIRRLKGGKPKPEIKPVNSKDLNSPPNKKHKKSIRKPILKSTK